MPRMKPISFAALLCVLGFASSAGGADRASPPAAIETEGVPPVPPELSAQLARYQAVRSARFLDWHPAGDGILVLSQLGPLHQLYLVARPGAQPRQLTAGDEPVSGGRYLPDGAVLFSRGRGGDENFQIFELDPKSDLDKLPAERLLTDGKSRNLLMRPSPDGKRVVFSSTKRNGRDADLYVLDREKRSPAEMLFQVERETWALADWLEDQKKAVLVRTISNSESYGVLLDLASRKIEPCAAETPAPGGVQGRQKVSRTDFEAGAGGRSLFFLSDARGEFRELARLDLASGRVALPVTLLGDGLAWDAENLTLSRDRSRAAFTLNADGLSELYLVEDLDAEAPRRHKLPLPAGVVADLRFSPDGKRLGFSFGRGAEPTEAYALDLATGAIERWTSSPRVGFGDGDFVAPRLIRIPSFDGREVPAFVYLPPPAADRPRGRAPVVISIHGGPESQSRPGFSDAYQFYVRELGTAVIAPNVRGSTGYGKSYSLLDNGRLREDSLKDIGALLDWIASETGGGALGLDPGRVAVTGGSYGGFMVLASLVRFGERIRAGVDSVGISDFITFLERTSPYRQDLRRAEYGDERDPEMRQFFERISPAKGIDKLRSALLLIHGKNDPRVPFSETVQVVEKARATGRPVWTVYAKNEGHGFTRRENRDFQQAVTVIFLREHLASSPTIATTRGSGHIIDLDLGGAKWVDHLLLAEDESAVGRVTRYVLEARAGREWRPLGHGRDIGARKSHQIRPDQIEKVRFRVLESSGEPVLREFSASESAAAPREALDEIKRRLTSGLNAEEAIGEMDRAILRFPGFAPLHEARGRYLDARESRAEALKAFDRALECEAGLPGLRHERASLLFRLEKFPEALRDYAESIAAGAGPHDADSCWERGLAWYYAGDFEAGQKQFEGYHRADSLDIENGLWRFLCIAEREGVPRAVETVLDYPRKVRPPFPALLALYSGRGSPEAVLEEARRGDPGAAGENERLFYAHYYIAKHFEVRREKAKALEQIEKALEHRIGHFMYDCARIDRNRLRR